MLVHLQRANKLRIVARHHNYIYVCFVPRWTPT